MNQKITARLAAIFVFPAWVFLLNYVVYKLTTLYDTAWWADVVMHFLGGWSIAYGGFLLATWAEEKNLIKIPNWLVRCAVVVMLVFTVAVLWEFYEFILDHLFAMHNQPSVFDTMKDLFMGMLGALFGSLIWRLKNKNSPLPAAPAAKGKKRRKK